MQALIAQLVKDEHATKFFLMCPSPQMTTILTCCPTHGDSDFLCPGLSAGSLTYTPSTQQTRNGEGDGRCSQRVLLGIPRPCFQLVRTTRIQQGRRVLYEFDARTPVCSARAWLVFVQKSRFSSLRSPSQHGSGGQVRQIWRPNSDRARAFVCGGTMLENLGFYRK